MSDFIAPVQQPAPGLRSEAARAPVSDSQATSDIGHRFEKMLWAEMLRHTGLEEAFTRSGGEGASAFSQFMVEAIAEDIASKHSLGLDPAGRAASAARLTDNDPQEQS